MLSVHISTLEDDATKADQLQVAMLALHVLHHVVLLQAGERTLAATPRFRTVLIHHLHHLLVDQGEHL